MDAKHAKALTASPVLRKVMAKIAKAIDDGQDRPAIYVSDHLDGVAIEELCRLGYTLFRPVMSSGEDVWMISWATNR